MRLPGAELTVTWVMVCSALTVPGKAAAQNTGSGGWTAPAQAASKQNPVAANEGSIAEGKKLYEQACLSCHGAAGKGDGPKADTLNVNPADFSNPKVRPQADCGGLCTSS